MNSAPSQTSTSSTTVEIYDQVYRLRGTDSAYIQRLAHMVDMKMKAVAAGGSTVDSLRVAVLAALNLADELESLRANRDAGLSRTRAGSLAGLLDEVLGERKVG